jgi:hypothetical protein
MFELVVNIHDNLKLFGSSNNIILPMFLHYYALYYASLRYVVRVSFQGVGQGCGPSFVVLFRHVSRPGREVDQPEILVSSLESDYSNARRDFLI